MGLRQQSSLSVPPQLQTKSMTSQLRLIELPHQEAPRLNRKLDHETRNLGRRGVVAARAALASARQLPQVDLDAA